MFCHMMLHHIIVMLPYLISSCSIMSNDTAVTLLLHSAYRVRGCTHNMRNTELALKSCSGTLFYVKPWYRYYRVRGRECYSRVRGRVFYVELWYRYYRVRGRHYGGICCEDEQRWRRMRRVLESMPLTSRACGERDLRW